MGSHCYRCVVIGLGRVGLTLENQPGRARPCTHCGSIAKHKRTLLVGGFDRDPSSRSKFQNLYPRAQFQSEDLEGFLKKTSPEIVSIAASSESHLEILRVLAGYQAKQNTLQGILLEKPVGLNVAEGFEALEIERKIKIPILVCHDRRFYREFNWIRSLPKRLGRILNLGFEIRTNWVSMAKRPRKNGFFSHGALLHDGTHLFDLLNFMVGPPAKITAFAHRFNPLLRSEEQISGQMLYQDGKTAHFRVYGGQSHFHVGLDIDFEKGRVHYAQGHLLFFEAKTGSPYFEKIQIETPKSINPYLKRLTTLFAMIEEGAGNPSSIKDGLFSLACIEAAYASASQGGIPISLNHLGRPLGMMGTWKQKVLKNWPGLGVD